MILWLRAKQAEIKDQSSIVNNVPWKRDAPLLLYIPPSLPGTTRSGHRANNDDIHSYTHIHVHTYTHIHTFIQRVTLNNTYNGQIERSVATHSLNDPRETARSFEIRTAPTEESRREPDSPESPTPLVRALNYDSAGYDHRTVVSYNFFRRFFFVCRFSETLTEQLKVSLDVIRFLSTLILATTDYFSGLRGRILSRVYETLSRATPSWHYWPLQRQSIIEC